MAGKPKILGCSFLSLHNAFFYTIDDLKNNIQNSIIQNWRIK